jgi:tetratricopeptide (TPR) repeat protein
MVRLVLLLIFVIAPPCFAQTAADYRRDAAGFARRQSWDQAITNYRKALELAPNDAGTHYNLALALKSKGESREALKEFQAALKRRPKWAEAHLSWLFTGSMNHPRAAHTTTLLPNGEVLAAGGEVKNSKGTFTVIGSAELYTP